MRSRFKALGRAELVWRVFLAGLAVLGMMALGRIVQKTAARSGGADAYAYWYHGLTLRQGGNPYRTSLEGGGPSLPVQHLGGWVTTSWPENHPRLNRMPFVTAPLALVLFQLSWFPWGLAKWLMTALNVAVALCIPWLVLRSFPHCASLSRQERWLVQLAFYAFVPTRVAVWLGQNTIPVFGLMLVALLVKERSWLLAGICLGLALSKYAVALPLVLLLLLRWRRRHGWMIVTALWVQVSAVVVISLRSGDSPLQLLQDHLEVFLSFAQWTGALGTQLQDIVPEGMPLPVAGVVLAVSVAALLSWWLRRWRRVPADCMPLADYQLWVVLVLSTLLVVYHSDYDVLMTVVFLPLGLYAIRHPSSWGLTPGQTRWLSAVTVMLVGVLILPGSIVSEVLSDAATEQWLGWVGLGVTLTVLVALATAVWLLMRFLRAARQQAPSSGAQARRSRWRA